MGFYERLETLRKDIGIGQGKLEKELGIANGSISKWKNRTPKLATLEKIANYFDVSVDYLTGKEEQVEPKPSDLFDFFFLDDFYKTNSSSQSSQSIEDKKEETYTSALFQDDVLIDLESELKARKGADSLFSTYSLFDFFDDDSASLEEIQNKKKRNNEYSKYILDLKIIKGYQQRIELFKQEIQELKERIKHYDLGNMDSFDEYPGVTYDDIRKFASKYSHDDLSDMEIAKMIAEIRNDVNTNSNIVPFSQYPTVTNKDIDEFAARNAKKQFTREEIAEMLYEMKKED